MQGDGAAGARRKGPTIRCSGKLFKGLVDLRSDCKTTRIEKVSDQHEAGQTAWFENTVPAGISAWAGARSVEAADAQKHFAGYVVCTKCNTYLRTEFRARWNDVAKERLSSKSVSRGADGAARCVRTPLHPPYPSPPPPHTVCRDPPCADPCRLS